MRSFIRYWLPVVLWASLILAASSNLFAARETGVTLASIIRAILGRDLSPELFAAMHFTIRKAAHLIEYAILGALALRAFRQQTPWTWRHAAAAVALAACVAIADEAHQSTLPSRTGTPADVAIDLAGAALAVGLTRLRQRLRGN